MTAHRIPRLLQALSTQAWALEFRTFSTGVDILRRKILGGTVFGTDLHAELGIAMPDAARRTRTTGDAGPTVAVIPIVGIIEQRASSLGASIEEIDAAFTSALMSRQLDAIVLDIDSPGGAVPGVPEFADKVFEARKVKPVVAIANSLAASAAYWIGSSAKEFWIARSGEAGSIGVFMLHQDWSKALEQDGIALTPISAGKYKVEGAPWEPLSEGTQTFYQEQVDEIYDWFVATVARNRGDTQKAVRAGYGEGRVLMAEPAVKANLVDRIGSLEEAIMRAAALADRPRRGRRAEAVRREIELEALRAG